MNVVVVGCGRMGSELAHRLYHMGHQVTVMDMVSTAFQNLPPDFVGRKIEGEILARDVLHRADMEHAQGVAAVTNSDAFNAVVGHIARAVFNVPNVVVRNYDPNWRALHDAFGFQVISSSSWGAQRTAEMISQATAPTVFSAGNGEVEIYEFKVGNAWDGHSLGQLAYIDKCIPVAITRGGHAELPQPEMVLREDVVILVSATLEGVQALRSRMDGLKEV
jgi:trk system potassium uptake protein